MRETLIRDLEEDLGRATAYLKVLAMDVETRFANGPVQCASLSHHVEQHTLSGSGLLSVRPEDTGEMLLWFWFECTHRHVSAVRENVSFDFG